MARALIDHGANVKFIDNMGRTVLLMAIAKASPALVRLLLEKGAEVNKVDRGGESALDSAVKLGRPDVASVLRAHGAKSFDELKAENGGCNPQ